MSKIRRKIAEKKNDYDVYKYSTITDKYGNETYGYSDNSDYAIHVMFVPIQSQVEIAEYGERINEMMQACLFSDEDIKENDHISIDGNMYNIVSIKPYPSYRQITVERLR